MYLKNLKRVRKKALIIVAHPDDETLFIGGTIAEFKRWRWTLLCVTDCDERYNNRRRNELLKVCNIYNNNGTYVKPCMLGIVKRKSRLLKDEVIKKIRDFIEEFGPFDIFFTHNSKGEYGHKTHRLIHNVITELKLSNVYNFMPLMAKPTNYTEAVELSPKSHRIKRQALNIYLNGSQKTNLLRIKRLLERSINTKKEWFSIRRADT